MYGNYPQYPQFNQPYMHDMRYQPPQMQAPAQTQITGQQDERLWVQGRDAALAYLIAPNSFVRLWDSSAPVFYEKRADATGRPYMEAYTYEKQAESASDVKAGEDYAEKIKALETRILALEKKGGKKVQSDKSDSDDTGV